MLEMSMLKNMVFVQLWYLFCCYSGLRGKTKFLFLDIYFAAIPVYGKTIFL